MESEDTKIISLSPLVSQIVLRKLGMFCSSYLGNDLYPLIEAINILSSEVSHERLEKMYKNAGKDWNQASDKLVELNVIVLKVKTFYDPIENKTFNKKSDPDSVESMLKKYFIRTGRKIALVQRDLFDMFIFLTKGTTLQRQQIPTDAFKILEHSKYRTIDITKKTQSKDGK